MTLALTLTPNLVMTLTLTLTLTLARYELCHIGGATFDTMMMACESEFTQLPSYLSPHNQPDNGGGAVSAACTPRGS